MAISNNITVQTKTTAAVTSTSSQQWGVSFTIGHSGGTDTTDLVDCQIIVFIMNYWYPASEDGITVSVDYPGNTYGTTTGSRGDISIEFVDYVAASYTPVIYPLHENERFNTVMKITFPNSTLQFTGDNSGVSDIQLRIHDTGYKQTKYFSGTTITDIEDSYSYRDSGGTNETSYDYNEKVCIYSGSTTLYWGTPPNTTGDVAIIDASNFSTIVENTPDVSYETGTTTAIGTGANYSKRSVFTGTDPSLSNVTIDRAELWLRHSTSQWLADPSVVDIVSLTSLPDSSPTWNEVSGLTGSIISQSNITSSWLNTTWSLGHDGTGFTQMVYDWVNDWSSNHKGFVVKFNDEVSVNGEQTFISDDNSSEVLRPIIVLHYSQSSVGPTKTRRIFIC